MPDQPCPNDSGECCMPGCEETASPIWSNRGLPKKCQACYRKESKRGVRAVMRSAVALSMDGYFIYSK